MGTTPFKWYSISELLADRYWDVINKTPKDEIVDHNKRHVHGRYDDRTEYNILGGFFKHPNISSMMLDHFCSVQGSICGEIEMQMTNCLEAYGLPKSYEKCEFYVDDYLECISRDKQFRRVIEMRKERHRQYKDGEREYKYAPPPKLWGWEF